MFCLSNIILAYEIGLCLRYLVVLKTVWLPQKLSGGGRTVPRWTQTSGRVGAGGGQPLVPQVQVCTAHVVESPELVTQTGVQGPGGQGEGLPRPPTALSSSQGDR